MLHGSRKGLDRVRKAHPRTSPKPTEARSSMHEVRVSDWWVDGWVWTCGVDRFAMTTVLNIMGA